MKKYILTSIILLAIFVFSCKKDNLNSNVQASDNLAVDSLVATKTNIKIYEQTFIKAYTRGKNLKFQWSANHGTIETTDSSMAMYWACPSCLGLNTIECKVSNEFGTVSDTIMINVFHQQ
jgi:hypothetical protein